MHETEDCESCGRRCIAWEDGQNILDKEKQEQDREDEHIYRERERLAGREDWVELSCIGTVHTEFETKRGKQKNGIIIFPAEGLRQQNYCSMRVWNGQWKQYIFRKNSAVWKTGSPTEPKCFGNQRSSKKSTPFMFVWPLT